MKKTIKTFALLLTALSINVIAQETAGVPEQTETDAAQTKAAVKETIDTAQLMQRRYGVRAGINRSSLGYRSMTGFQVGAAAEIPLALVDIRELTYTIGAQPSALLASKGGRIGRGYYYLLYNYSYTIDAYYLQVPVPFSFGRTFSKNFSGRLELGPYFALGLFGSYKGPNLNISAFSSDGLSRFDVGFHYGAALEFLERKFYLGIHNSDGFTDDYISAFYLTLGYNF